VRAVAAEMMAVRLMDTNRQRPARWRRSFRRCSRRVERWTGTTTQPQAYLGMNSCASVATYRSVFDPSGLAAEVAHLEAEHKAMMHRYADLPTPRVKEKAKGELAALEARIEELEGQQQNVADAIEQHYRQMTDLQEAVHAAREAMRSEVEERALRQRAEALRAVVQRIECTFTATGQTGGGWGKKNARLATVTIYPVGGDPVAFGAESKGTLMYSSAHSFMNRTCVGRTR
jgi:hypothetical protein